MSGARWRRIARIAFLWLCWAGQSQVIVLGVPPSTPERPARLPPEPPARLPPGHPERVTGRPPTAVERSLWARLGR